MKASGTRTDLRSPSAGAGISKRETAASALTASTSPADSRSNSERGSPDPGQQALGVSPAATAAKEVTGTPASEIRGVFDTAPHSMNDSVNSSTAIGGGGEDLDESFDMLANMPPTPGGGLVAPSGGGGGGDDDNHDAQESFPDMLGIPDSSPTTPAAVAVQQGGGSTRRSPRLAASAGGGTGTGGRTNRSLLPSSGVVKGRRGVGAGGGIGGASGGGGGAGAGGNIKTPYSNRRNGRRSGGQQAFPDRALTPGTAASNADADDANASFMTAIMGSVDGSTGDPGSVLRRANLFPADFEHTPATPAPVNVNIAEDAPAPRDAPAATPSFDMALASVEKRVAAVKLTDEDPAAASTTAAAADACCPNGDGDEEDIEIYPGDGGGADGVNIVALALDDPMPSLSPSPAPERRSGADATGPAASAVDETDDGGEAAGQAKPWLEPPSPAVVPLSSSSSSSSKRAAGRPTTFSPKETASAEVSPYGAKGRNGGGLSTSSTFGVFSDDEDVFAVGAAGGGGGAGGAVAEMTLPTLPKVEESLAGGPAVAAGVVAEAGDDEAVSGLRDVAGGNTASASADAESSVILEDMLQNAAGLRASEKLAAAAGASSPALAPSGGESKGSAAVLSAVEKEAMALAAACVAEQKAISHAPEAEDAGVEATAGVQREPAAAAAAVDAQPAEGGQEEPEVTGEENDDGDRAGEAVSFSKGGVGAGGTKRKTVTPGKATAAAAAAASGPNNSAGKKIGSDLKTSSVSISRVGLPAAVSARRGSTSGGGSRRSSIGISIRPESPARARSGVMSRSPPRSGLRRPSPSPSRRGGSSAVRPPSPSTAPRRQSMAFGSRVSSSDAATAATAAKKLEAAEPVDGAAAPAPAAAAAAVVKRATSRGRERASMGGFGFGRGRDNASTSGGVASAATAAAAPAVAAPVVVAALNPSSRLLAATKVSQGRARPRSASPAVSSARGRASTGGLGGPGGPGAGASRRSATAGPTPLQQQQQRQQQRQEQQQQPRPRSASTGRRALTMPKTPNLRTSNRPKPGKAHESTEDSEFRKQQAMQEQLKQATRKNQAGMTAAFRTAYSGNVRSTKPLTVPESPAMKTVGRLGGKVYAAVGPQDQAGFSPTHPAKNDPLSKDSLTQLAAQPKGPTVPAPFQLSKSNRVSRDRAGSAPGTPRSREETLTFRESLARIENKTPDRFRTKPAGEQPKPASGPRVDPKPTLPQSPRFRTEARAAGHSKTHVMSREEREEAELAEMKKHQFKARPYNADGFGVGGEQGVFRPQHSDKKLTQPAPFRLSSDDRASKRAPSPHRNRDEEELSKQFKARPMPGGRSSSVGRVRPGAKVSADLKPLTVAASPTFSTKRRSALRSNSLGGAGMKTSEDAELEKAAANKFRARPMPDYSRLAQSRRRSSAVAPAEPAPGPTEPQPFNLRSDARGKAKQALLEKRVQDQRRQEEAAARVRARPLPAPSHGFCPQPSDRPLTEPSEFSLTSQARHEKAEREFRERVRQEEARARRAAEVIALPLPAATFEPELYPERTEISLTQPVEVMMHSSARAEGRAKWDEENQARLAEEERTRRAEAESTAAAEKRAISELRRRSQADGGMCFKAKPIKWNNTPPEVAQLSTAALTTPITPNLRTKRRAMNAPREPPAPIS